MFPWLQIVFARLQKVLALGERALSVCSPGWIYHTPNCSALLFLLFPLLTIPAPYRQYRGGSLSRTLHVPDRSHFGKYSPSIKPEKHVTQLDLWVVSHLVLWSWSYICTNIWSKHSSQMTIPASLLFTGRGRYPFKTCTINIIII